MCAEYDSRRVLTAILVCHVGDVLFNGADSDQALVEQVILAFRASDEEHLTFSAPIISAGLLFGLIPGRPAAMSRNQYAAEIPKIDPSEYVT